MGLRPTRANENQRCRPRESGDPLSFQWIPAFAGMTRFAGDHSEGSYPGPRFDEPIEQSAMTS